MHSCGTHHHFKLIVYFEAVFANSYCFSRGREPLPIRASKPVWPKVYQPLREAPPHLASFPGRGAQGQSTPELPGMGGPLGRRTGQTMKQSQGTTGTDPSILGLPGPLWPGKGLLCHTQGDHFSGWGQMERPLGRKTSPLFEWHSIWGAFSSWKEQGAPTVSGWNSPGHIQFPFLRERCALDERKSGGRKWSDRMPGHLPLRSSGMVSQVGSFLSAADPTVVSKNGVPAGRWQWPSPPGNVA